MIYLRCSLTAAAIEESKSLTAQSNSENTNLDEATNNDLAVSTCTHRKRKREERSDGRTCKKNKVS
jgi:hypothetical protein